jgi:asparagine synthetase B (glutamine-hydrolysing)
LESGITSEQGFIAIAHSTQLWLTFNGELYNTRLIVEESKEVSGINRELVVATTNAARTGG